MTERQFQNWVITLAKRMGWLVYHTHDSRRSQAGFPDLVLVREVTLFRELKTETGRIRPEQRIWAKRLTESGADYALWRPSDKEEIIKKLTQVKKSLDI